MDKLAKFCEAKGLDVINQEELASSIGFSRSEIEELEWWGILRRVKSSTSPFSEGFYYDFDEPGLEKYILCEGLAKGSDLEPVIKVFCEEEMLALLGAMANLSDGIQDQILEACEGGEAASFRAFLVAMELEKIFLIRESIRRNWIVVVYEDGAKDSENIHVKICSDLLKRTFGEGVEKYREEVAAMIETKAAEALFNTQDKKD